MALKRNASYHCLSLCLHLLKHRRISLQVNPRLSRSSALVKRPTIPHESLAVSCQFGRVSPTHRRIAGLFRPPRRPATRSPSWPPSSRSGAENTFHQTCAERNQRDGMSKVDQTGLTISLVSSKCTAFPLGFTASPPRPQTVHMASTESSCPTSGTP